VKRFWRRDPLGFEAELRAGRPQPRPDFVRALATRVREDRRHPLPFRVALAGGLTAAMLVAVAAVGGLGYAATAAKQAFDGVQQLIAVNDSPEAIQVGLSPGGDQYQPGFSWGDPDQAHDGPPGLTRAGGEFAPPLQVLCSRGVAVTRVRLVLDEQADLRVSVLGPHSKRLPLTRGQGGETTKTLRYRILVPRVLRLALRMPCSLLQPGLKYQVRITATDPSGETSRLLIPFRPFAATE
jgi:hypothetical protein